MNAKLGVFGTILALQTAWVVGTALVHEHKLTVGKVVLLETRPVDPRDMLRGDYVILNYGISRLSNSLFSPPVTASLPAGKTVYVALEPRGEFYEAVAASTSPMEVRDSRVLLKGVVRQGWNPNEVWVNYGLERFYVPEGTGNPEGKLTVRAAISKSGAASVKEVLVNGKPYSEVMRHAVAR